MTVRNFIGVAMSLALLAIPLRAQQPNTANASLNLNAPASAAVPAPAVVSVFTDSVVDINIQASPSGPSPVVVVFAVGLSPGESIDLAAAQGFGFQLDIPDQGQPGYADQAFVYGFQNANHLSVTSPSGLLQLNVVIPSCGATANSCLPFSNLEISAQALVIDPTAPFFLRTTGAGVSSVINGHQEMFLSGDGSQIFDFKDGFTFSFYGINYTRAWVSANGYISFEEASAGFPNPNLVDIAAGTPRIMSYYSDLQPEIQAFNPRIYAQQFEESGPGGVAIRKIKFVHENLAEFANTTGPHGGEIIITESGEIDIAVGAYNGIGGIAAGIGITPGSLLGVTPSGNGRDLSSDVAGGPTTLGMGVHGFELFPGAFLAVNPLDLAGVSIEFIPDPGLVNNAPGNSGYLIQ